MTKDKLSPKEYKLEMIFDHAVVRPRKSSGGDVLYDVGITFLPKTYDVRWTLAGTRTDVPKAFSKADWLFDHAALHETSEDDGNIVPLDSVEQDLRNFGLTMEEVLTHYYNRAKEAGGI